MCGVIGIVGTEPVAERLLKGLQRLEYRGYDSAGLAIRQDTEIIRCREVGKVTNLQSMWQMKPVNGNSGIAHIRWATHGLPTVHNAHPHQVGPVTLVHNGIIENYEELRELLASENHTYESETDTEVAALLIAKYVRQGKSPKDAVLEATKLIKGAYALIVMVDGYPNVLIGARKGSPLAVGVQDDEGFIGSDSIALAGLVSRITYLEDGDVVEVQGPQVQIYDAAGHAVMRMVHPMGQAMDVIQKAPYPHFMLKEIHEQPQVLRQTLSHYLSETKDHLRADFLPETALNHLTRVTLVACGTSFYAALVAKYWIETMARLPVDIDIASEFRYRQPPLAPKGLAIFISQSGETADTLAAQAYAKSQGQYCVGIVNVPHSSLARAVDHVLMTHAGPEIGVASTKAFMTQLGVLACLALFLGQRQGTLTAEGIATYCHEMAALPVLLEQMLSMAPQCQDLAQVLVEAKDVLYLGRGTSYAIAMEGALKLKEITYIHAEGYAAGEMKHGPIALIDSHVPIIAIAPHDGLYEKTISNIQEAAARQGQVFLITDATGRAKYKGALKGAIEIPGSSVLTSPFLATIPVQLLAYYTAVAKGTDVDQPRNLAKSVTVE